tara:strand:- start:116 stop:367 length:252 start_codon:yes stop_codon:yes gene_type:complete
MANTLDSTILDSLVEGYQAKILAEKQRLQQAENVKVEAARNIDRLEGALIGVKDAIAKLASSENEDAPPPECGIDQQPIEGQE